MKIASLDTMKVVSNLQLCAGQQAGADVAVHTAREIFAGKECDAVLLVEALKAYNTPNRQAVMHNISVLCPALAICIKNTYEAAPRLFVTKDIELRSEEGSTQGDPIAMTAYALGLSALQSKISLNSGGTSTLHMHMTLLVQGNCIRSKTNEMKSASIYHL